MVAKGIILIILSLLCLIYIIFKRDEYEKALWAILFTLFICFGILMIVIGTPTRFYLKNNNLNIEVRQEIVNGQEISIDTIYIFTPKKK